MIKKILCLALVIFIVAGAIYSYNKVGFGQKTAMLFRVVFGDEGGFRTAPGGGPPQGGPMEGGTRQGGGPEGGTRQGGPPPSIGGTGESQSRPDFGPAMGSGDGSQQPQPGFRPEMTQGAGRSAGQPGNARGGQPPGRRSISLENVIPYAFILAFFVLITRFVELIIRKEFGTRFSDWICFRS